MSTFLFNNVNLLKDAATQKIAYMQVKQHNNKAQHKTHDKRIALRDSVGS